MRSIVQRVTTITSILVVIIVCKLTIHPVVQLPSIFQCSFQFWPDNGISFLSRMKCAHGVCTWDFLRFKIYLYFTWTIHDVHIYQYLIMGVEINFNVLVVLGFVCIAYVYYNCKVCSDLFF